MLSTYINPESPHLLSVPKVVPGRCLANLLGTRIDPQPRAHQEHSLMVLRLFDAFFW